MVQRQHQIRIQFINERENLCTQLTSNKARIFDWSHLAQT